MVDAVHGGDAPKAAARYGIAADSLLDFSANIDPFGPPNAVREILEHAARNPRLLGRYPSQQEFADACAAIANANGVDPEAIVLGAGGASLIDLAVRFVDAKQIVVPIPAFSEYARAVAAAGKRFVEFRLETDFGLDTQGFLQRLDTDAAGLLNSPHNPSGLALSRERLLAVLDSCEKRARDLVVDEAFIDYIPEQSIGVEASRSAHAVVIRSLTKFYAIAGVRVGFAILRPDRARRFRGMQPSWPVGRLELQIAKALHLDDGYAARARARNEKEREALAASLRDLGVTVFPGVANFLMLELPCSSLDPLLARLVCDYRLLVRDCRTYRALEGRAIIRVAVLDAVDNARLVAALREVLNAG